MILQNDGGYEYSNEYLLKRLNEIGLSKIINSGVSLKIQRVYCQAEVAIQLWTNYEDLFRS